MGRSGRESWGDFRWDLEKFYYIECGTPTPSLRRKLKVWVNSLGLHCVAIFRFAQFSRKLWRRNRLLGLPFMLAQTILAYWVKQHYLTDIFAAEIGPGFYISHVGNIYIGACIIGPNLSVTHNVTLGTNNAEGLVGLPNLGSSVWIGTGSVIYGKINIGSGVTVNCGSILSKSIPDNCLVGGNPARVIQMALDNSESFAGFVPPASSSTSAATLLPASQP
ncbi:MAG: serine acetyltransferase [Fibrobacteria bacterium]